MGKDHGPTIKDDDRYEALLEEGVNREKAARVANTPAKVAGRRGGLSRPYEDRTKTELYKKAKEVGIVGRSKMNKKQLIKALRYH